MSKCELLLSKGNIHNPVAISLILVNIFSSFMMWKFVCVKTDLYPASQLFLMEINELCFSTDSIWRSIVFLRSCGNANVNYLVDIIVTTFVKPTMIGGLLEVVCSWGLLGLI